MELTNLTELLERDAIRRLLYLCGAKEGQIGADCSDYELFRTFCQATPLLTGHWLPRSIGDAMQRELGLSLPLSPDNCDALWHACAESLVLEPRHQPLTLTVPLTSDSKAPEWRFLQTSLVLDGASLLDTDADSWCDWEAEMRSRLDAFFGMGGRIVRLVPDQDACESIPDLYHVEQALKEKASSPVLTAQLFRFLAAELQKREAMLWLDADSCGVSAVSILSYVERCVGLPTLIWTCPYGEAFDVLCDWQARPHGFEVRFAVKDGISDREVQEILRTYPQGRLWKLCDRPDGNGLMILQI